MDVSLITVISSKHLRANFEYCFSCHWLIHFSAPLCNETPQKHCLFANQTLSPILSYTVSYHVFTATTPFKLLLSRSPMIMSLNLMIVSQSSSFQPQLVIPYPLINFSSLGFQDTTLSWLFLLSLLCCFLFFQTSLIVEGSFLFSLVTHSLPWSSHAAHGFKCCIFANDSKI